MLLEQDYKNVNNKKRHTQRWQQYRMSLLQKVHSMVFAYTTVSMKEQR